MKVCLFTENHYKGGLDTFLINLINAWPDPDDALTLLCNASHPGLATIEAGVRRPVLIERYRYLFVSRIAVGKGEGLVWQSLPVRLLAAVMVRLLQYPVLFPWYVMSLTVRFRGSDYSRLMVVNGGYPGSLLCRSASIAWRLAGKRPRAIHNFHNFAVREPWYRRGLENCIDRWVARSTSSFVSVSRTCLESLRCRDAFRSSKDLIGIPNGIDDPGERRQDTSASGGPEPPSGRYLLMLATCEPRKGHGYLLDAMAIILKEHPDITLVMYGQGKPRERSVILRKIESLGLSARASLRDFVQDTDRLIRKAAVLVVPSQAFESFGLTIIEGMARRTPVVATRVGGMPEVIEDGRDGLLADPGDPADFARAVNSILASPSFADRLASEGRAKFACRYQASSMAAAYHRVLSAG